MNKFTKFLTPRQCALGLFFLLRLFRLTVSDYRLPFTAPLAKDRQLLITTQGSLRQNKGNTLQKLHFI